MPKLTRAHLLRLGLGALLAFGAIQLVPVDGVGENPDARHPLDAPSDVAEALRAACYDCHSNETAWPWYSRVAPVAWVVATDVRDGRAALNFSEWDAQLPEDRQFAREALWEQIELGDMPPAGYLLLHPEVRFTEEEKSAIAEWAKASAPSPGALAQDAPTLGAPALDGAPDATDDDGVDPRATEGQGAGGAGNTGAGNTGAGNTGAEGAGGAGPSEAIGSGGAAHLSPTPKSPRSPSAESTAPPPRAPSPKPNAPPRSETPGAPAAPPNTPPAPKGYEGPNPCLAKSFRFSNVRAACERGGLAQAKSLMKTLVKRAKDNGVSYKCSSCHSNQKTYEQNADANTEFRKLLDAAK